MATDTVGIKLELMGYDGVMRDLRTLDSYIKAHKREEIRLNLDSAKREVMALRGELNRLQSEIKSNQSTLRENTSSARQLLTAFRQGKIGIKEFREQLHGFAQTGREARDAMKQNQAALQEAQGKYRNAAQAVRELSYALRECKSQMTWMQAFGKISSSVGHVGSALQSFGNALTRVSSLYERFTSGMVMGLGFQAIGKVTEGLKSGFERYDVMKKYPLMMQAFGYSAEEAQKSIDTLDMSVRGLPTGLDEILDMAQRFVATTGDIDKGTQLAIATNNAFLASMSTSTQQYQGMMQLQDVLGGKDMNAREWNSLVSSMTPAIVKMGESLGYTKDNMNEYIQAVRDGKVSNEEFIDTLIKVGTGEGEVAKMAELSKQTFEAFSRNVKNAFSRMGYGILTALDEVAKSQTGKTVNQLLIDMLPKIDEMTEKIKAWIKANPDKIADFFNKFKGIDWLSLLKGFAQGIGLVANALANLAASASGKDLSLLGKLFYLTGPLGRLLTITGGLLKGTRHIFGFLGATAVMVSVMRGGGLIGRIMSMFGGANWAGTLTAAPTAMTTLRTVLYSLGPLMKAAGVILIPAVTGFTAVKALKSIIKDLKEVSELVHDVDWESAATALIAFGTFIGAFASLAYLIGDASATLGTFVGKGVLKGELVLGAITTLASGIAALDMKLIKSAFKSFEEVTTSLKTGIENLQALPNVTGANGILTNVGNAISIFHQISELFNGKYDVENGGIEGGIQPFTSDFLGTIRNLATAIKEIAGLGEPLQQIKELKFGEKVRTKIEDLFASMGTIYEAIPEDMKTAGKYGAEDRAAAFDSVVKSFVSTFESLNQLATQAQLINSWLNNRDFQTMFKDVKTQIKDLFADLSEIYASFSGAGLSGLGDASSLATKLDNFKKAFESINGIFKYLKRMEKRKLKTTDKGGGGDFLGIAQIRKLMTQLSTAFERAGVLNSQIQNFVNNVKTLMEAISELNTNHEINMEIKLKGNAVQGYTEVVRRINDAVDAINRAINKIPTNVRKTVSVTIGANVNTGGAIASINNAEARVRHSGIQEHTGGLVHTRGVLYRSGGGSIFKPKGTDVVPAMLTEGEYVHNRQAVNMFGLDFMRKVNSLDVRGAVQSLLSRGGLMASTFGRQTTFNHTINNNQRVTQNITSNNPQMARMSLGRFAGEI